MEKTQAGRRPVSRVLVVDDDELIVQSYVRSLGSLGYGVDTACNGAQALQRFRSHASDVILSDLSMPDMDGLMFLRELRRFDLDVPVVIVTGTPSLDSAMEALEYGAFRYIMKPASMKVLDGAITKAAGFHAMARLRRQALSLVEQSGHALGDRASLEARLESAMATVQIAFQPIVSWQRREVFGYEALLRTREPTLLRPDHFLDCAMQLGRLAELGRLVRARTAEEALKASPDTQFFVNVAVADLADEDLMLAAAPLSQLAARVTLEVTERTSLYGLAEIRERLETLRAMGYRLAVDDLGAGYAGLSSLSTVDPEVVKLDMSLVRDVDSNPAKQQVIRSMRRLIEELGMLLIVEGVETVAERDTLADLGCDLMQGYLFARPGFGFAVPDMH